MASAASTPDAPATPDRPEQTPAGPDPTDPADERADPAPARSAERPVTDRATSKRTVARSTALYSISILALRLGSVIMLPITTRVLTPAEFGLVYLLVSVSEVVNILVSEGTTTGLVKFYVGASSEDERREVVTGTLVLLLAQAVVSTLLVLAVSPLIYEHLMHGKGSRAMIYVLALVFVPASLSPVPMAVMQVQQRAALASALSLGQFALQIGLNVLFLLVFRLGPVGILLSTLVAFTVTGLVAVAWLLRSTRPRWRWATALRQRRFGVPYQLSAIAIFVLNSGDRFVLQATQQASVTGLYILGYQFGFLMYSVSAAPFLQAWTPTAFQHAKDPRPARDRHFAEGLFALTALMMLVSVGIVAFARPALRIMSRAEFVAAADLVGPIVLAYACNGWYTLFRTQLDISAKGRVLPWINGGAALVAVAGYLLLIPPYGRWGGAAATLIAFAGRAVATYYAGQRAWPVEWEFRRPVVTTALAMGLSGVLLWVRPDGLAGMIAAGVALVAVFVAACWALVVTPAERALVGRLGQRLVGMVQSRLNTRPA